MGRLEIINFYSCRIILVAGLVLSSQAKPNELLDAVLLGDYAKAQESISIGVDLDAVDGQRGPPLFAAVDAENVEIVTLLLESGADTEVPAKLGKQTPLHRAASKNNAAIVRLLAEHGAKIDSLDFNKGTPLFAAVSSNALGAIRALVEAGADPKQNWRARGYPALHRAVSLGYIDVVKLLLELGSDINQLSTKKWTVMELAVTESSLYGAGDTGLITFLAQNQAPGASAALLNLRAKGLPTSKEVSPELYHQALAELERIVAEQGK